MPLPRGEKGFYSARRFIRREVGWGVRWCLVLISGLAACVPAAAATPTLTATPVIRPTLPATWTPTPTFTLLPPAVTTPATAAPTPEAAAACESWTLQTNLDRRRVFTRDMRITVVTIVPTPEVTARFLAVHRLTGANRGVDMAGGMGGFQLPVSLLPGTGRFDWTVSLISPVYGEMCARGGWFIVTARADRHGQAVETE